MTLPFFKIKILSLFIDNLIDSQKSRGPVYLILMILFAGSGCASSHSRVLQKTAMHESTGIISSRNNIVRSAETFIGSGYRYGGFGPSFDCSGLVYRIYSELGYPIERSASRQCRQGISKALKQAEAGDLVFFRKRGQIDHVAIITEYRRGRLNVIHSTSSQGVVKEDVLKSNYWRKRIGGIRDLLAR